MRGAVRWVPIALVGATLALGSAPETFLKDWNDWRAAREARLRSENGWLTLVALHWLSPGANSLEAGTFIVSGDTVTIRAKSPGLVKSGKTILEDVVTIAESSGDSEPYKQGNLSLVVIKRVGRFGVRVKDPASPVRLGFKGIETFAPDPAWRIEATWVPYEKPRKVRIPNVLGTAEEMEVRGYASFRAGGKDLRLEPVVEDPEHPSLFFIFKDLTSGKETYPAGRFLYSEMPVDGKVVIDFNRAYNPPCAFTPYATCPLPPKQNALGVRVEAGEKTFEHGPKD